MTSQPHNQTLAMHLDLSSAKAPTDPHVKYVHSLKELVGQTFHGQYELLSVIGEGAMGVVFEAHQKGLGRVVALKLMKAKEMASDEEALARFEAETKLVGCLSHPNIVRLFDAGYEPGLGVYYVAMERIEGVSLATALEGKRCHPALALEVVYQVCSGLTEPHGNGVVHRDLKPDNIVLSRRSDGALEVKVLDFGIARALRSDARLTQAGVVMGTPAYMAPELAMDQEIDARTDLYALGIVLFEMLTGDIPHKDTTPVNVLLKHMNEPIPKLCEFWPDITNDGVQALLDGMTAKSIQERVTTAFEVCEWVDKLRVDRTLCMPKLGRERRFHEEFEQWLKEPLIEHQEEQQLPREKSLVVWREHVISDEKEHTTQHEEERTTQVKVAAQEVTSPGIKKRGEGRFPLWLVVSLGVLMGSVGVCMGGLVLFFHESDVVSEELEEEPGLAVSKEESVRELPRTFLVGPATPSPVLAPVKASQGPKRDKKERKKVRRLNRSKRGVGVGQKRRKAKKSIQAMEWIEGTL